jgi:hypothetical protein
LHHDARSISRHHHGRRHRRALRHLLLEHDAMKAYTVKIKHIATGKVYSVPVLARSRSDAEFKAGQWPYTTDAYIVLKGE